MNTEERNDQIHEKGFDIYSKIKIGSKQLEDIVLDLSNYKPLQHDHPFCDKHTVLKAIMCNDLDTMCQISNFFYRVSGIYERICNYFAFLYRYDWYVAPEVYDDNIKEEKILKELSKTLNYLDNSYIKKMCGDISSIIMREGCYYGYVVKSNEKVIIQQLPRKYCRSRYSHNGVPCVEFNMRFFDTFGDPNYRMKILKLFPEEFKKGYMLYKQGRLPLDFAGDTNGWYLLDPEFAIKFNYNGSDQPPFVNAIPYLIDLDAAQALDRKKQMQKLLKILVQKLPLDKNNDLIFDVDEARDIHNNAIDMMQGAVGVDVLTTFADIEVFDMADKNTSTTVDDLSKVERSVYDAFGTAKNLFNSDSNLSLNLSILNDESTMRNLLLQYTIFFDKLTQKQSKNKSKYNFKFYMLETTQYNYKDISKMYKEQTQIGYSKMLPQIALGHSQSFILNSVVFENDILHLSEIMIPPLMSSTMSSADVLNKGKTSTSAQPATGEAKGDAGRPEKSDDQKSDKTIANKESM